MVNQCQCAVGAPVEDDLWGYITNYNGFILECCRMHMREGSMAKYIGGVGLQLHLVTAGSSARESVSQWHWEDVLPLDASQANQCTSVVNNWKHHIGMDAGA